MVNWNSVIEIASGILLKMSILQIFGKIWPYTEMNTESSLGKSCFWKFINVYGATYFGFQEPLSTCSPNGLNKLQIRLTNAEREENTFRKVRITYKRPENVSSILRIIFPHTEEIPLTLMGIFFFNSQCLLFCLCCIAWRRLQEGLMAAG